MNNSQSRDEPPEKRGSNAKKLLKSLYRAANWPTKCPGKGEINRIFEATILIVKLVLVLIATISAAMLLVYVVGA